MRRGPPTPYRCGRPTGRRSSRSEHPLAPRCDARIVLTQAQQALLALIADGLTGAQIGRRLKLSEGQVGRRAAGLLQRLGARTREQAIDIGCRAGLLGCGPACGRSR
ncbi:hypothetical protein GCM10009639_19600 [Kitasatospora putterlickiae]|uniref:HTH luxR-type domain-containing protein n=1 Tax=Kitasatospora putterlickiae TaxID=221725 RepID=A0ABN1XV70_9ACTN